MEQHTLLQREECVRGPFAPAWVARHITHWDPGSRAWEAGNKGARHQSAVGRDGSPGLLGVGVWPVLELLLMPQDVYGFSTSDRISARHHRDAVWRVPADALRVGQRDLAGGRNWAIFRQSCCVAQRCC